MRPALLAHALHQHGLVTRNQALRAGYSEGEVRALTRTTGPWVTVRRGVYADGELWHGLRRDEQDRRRVRAVLMLGEQHLRASHASAALLQAVPLLEHSRTLVHMSAPGITGGRTEHGVKYHPARVPAADRVTTPYGPATGLARTACDLAREDGHLAGLVAADHALRNGVPRAGLERVVAGMRCWPGVTVVRGVVAEADGGAANPGETLLRSVVSGLGWGRPRTQVRFADETRTADVDLLLGCHVFEFDGRVKYGRDRPYDDRRPGDEVLWEEKRREDWLRARPGVAGLSRVVWDEVWAEAHRADAGPLRRRLAAEVSATIARVGLPTWLAALSTEGSEGSRHPDVREGDRPA